MPAAKFMRNVKNIIFFVVCLVVFGLVGHKVAFASLEYASTTANLYHLNNNYTDSSGHGYTLIGGNGYSTFAAPGKFGSYAWYSGVYDSDAYAYATSTSDSTYGTIVCSFKLAVLPTSTTPYICQHSSAANAISISIYINSDDTLKARYARENIANYYLTTTSTLSIDTWYNVIGSYDTGGVQSLYLNGQLVSSGATSGIGSGSVPSCIGIGKNADWASGCDNSYLPDTYQLRNGYIDEVFYINSVYWGTTEALNYYNNYFLYGTVYPESVTLSFPRVSTSSIPDFSNWVVVEHNFNSSTIATIGVDYYLPGDLTKHTDTVNYYPGLSGVTCDLPNGNGSTSTLYCQIPKSVSLPSGTSTATAYFYSASSGFVYDNSVSFNVDLSLNSFSISSTTGDYLAVPFYNKTGSLGIGGNASSSEHYCGNAPNWYDVGGGIRWGMCSALVFAFIPNNYSLSFIQNAFNQYSAIPPFSIVLDIARAVSSSLDNYYNSTSSGVSIGVLGYNGEQRNIATLNAASFYEFSSSTASSTSHSALSNVSNYIRAFLWVSCAIALLFMVKII